MRFDRRMSAAEALMWNVEKDPSLRSSFLNVTFLDKSPDFDAFRRRIERAVAEIPRLRQRVVSPPARLAPPEWADDPAFDLDFHVRHVGVPPPGDDRALLDMAALIAQDAFDRARPLWQYTIVDGLDGDRAALLAKMHHTITDGVGGVRLSAMFLDLERDAPEPPPVEASPVAAGDDGFVEAAARALQRQLRVSRRTATTAVSTALRPYRLPSQAGDAVGLARSVLRQMVVTDPARSPLWAGRRSLTRQFEVLSVDLDRLKAVANSLGGTVNDAFVCAVAGGVGAYHREKGAEVDELRMSMPVNVRDDKSAGGNAFTPTRLLVPVGLKDPVERFAAIRERLTQTKGERGLDMTEAFAGVLGVLPTSVLVGFARQQVETVDFATSNVRGAPFDLFTAGARVQANHPMGPTAGTAFNITALSYRGSFDMGLNVDTAAIDDAPLLRRLIEESFAELLSAG
jgi:diacylglycerol O-acyltransferase / wax synthase